MEVLGDQPNVLTMHFHYLDGAEDDRSTGQDVRTDNLAQDWHVYGLEWSKDAITWFLDGKPVWQFADAARIPAQPMYLLMNLAVGGEWPGNPDKDTVFPAEFQIDYVRIWQREH